MIKWIVVESGSPEKNKKNKKKNSIIQFMVFQRRIIIQLIKLHIYNDDGDGQYSWSLILTLAMYDVFDFVFVNREIDTYYYHYRLL